MRPDKQADLSFGLRVRFLLVSAATVTSLLVACGTGNESLGESTPPQTPIPIGISNPTATPIAPTPTSIDEIVLAQDFELPRAGGGTVKLSDVYAESNTVLVFYRGYF